MIQEAITYMIVGSAVTIAVYKIYLKLRKKRVNRTNISNIDYKPTGHNCSDCSAECMLRNASQSVILENKTSCNTIRTDSNEL